MSLGDSSDLDPPLAVVGVSAVVRGLTVARTRSEPTRFVTADPRGRDLESSPGFDSAIEDGTRHPFAFHGRGGARTPDLCCVKAAL